MQEIVNIPRHIAFILDGNGRWAKKRMLPRNLGHRKGAFNIADIAKACRKYGIEVMSIYCFSTENWRRPQAEVDYLMELPLKYFKKYKDKIIDSDYKIVFSGLDNRIPLKLKEEMDYIVDNTKEHKGLLLNVCFDYGSQRELVDAFKKIYQDIIDKKITIANVDEDIIMHNLYQDLPPVDLMIRTSGEKRISNFMLWQIAYAELYFTDTLWPDFNEESLKEALVDYSGRNRRFGGLTK